MTRTGSTFDVVICTRNNRDVIAGTLGGVSSQTWRPETCLVVDGQSSDRTAEFVRESFGWAQVIVKAEDSGPAASRNLGCSKGKAPFVLLLDSDVTLAPDWAERQMQYLDENPRCAAVSGKLLYASDPKVLNAAYGAMNRYGVAWGIGDRQPASSYTEPRRCLWNLTAAMMVRRSALQQIGGFDERMFAFHEDSDFGWRANLFGYHVAWNPEAVAYHHSHSTMNRSSMGDHRAFLAYRNRFRSALINYEPFHLVRYMGIHLLLFIIQGILKPPRWAHFRALWWNLRMLPDTLERRRFVQGRRSIRDRELWPLFEGGFRGPGYD